MSDFKVRFVTTDAMIIVGENCVHYPEDADYLNCYIDEDVFKECSREVARLGGTEYKIYTYRNTANGKGVSVVLGSNIWESFGFVTTPEEWFLERNSIEVGVAESDSELAQELDERGIEIGEYLEDMRYEECMY